MQPRHVQGLHRDTRTNSHSGAPIRLRSRLLQPFSLLSKAPRRLHIVHAHSCARTSSHQCYIAFGKARSGGLRDLAGLLPRTHSTSSSKPDASCHFHSPPLHSTTAPSLPCSCRRRSADANPCPPIPALTMRFPSNRLHSHMVVHLCIYR